MRERLKEAGREGGRRRGREAGGRGEGQGEGGREGGGGNKGRRGKGEKKVRHRREGIAEMVEKGEGKKMAGTKYSDSNIYSRAQHTKAGLNSILYPSLSVRCDECLSGHPTSSRQASSHTQ